MKWVRTGRRRYRPGFWGGLILQVEERAVPAGRRRWRDARVQDLKPLGSVS